MENNESFNYTYSAKLQKEVLSIRKKYEEPNDGEDKMEYLRRLDIGVTQKAQSISLVFGIVGALIMGVGMSLVMSDFAKILGNYKEYAVLIGILIGIVGMVLVGFAYPIYNYIIKKERKRIAPEILRVTDELLQ